MSSSEASETVEPESSGSLETMLGFSTETGRATALTPSSSSGAQALSNPTLDSSEISRPATPPVERGPSPALSNMEGLAVAGRAPRRNFQPR